MDFIATRVRAWIRACTPPLFTADNSFRTYGIASHYRLEEEALCAARLTLECSMDFNTLGEDLRFISGADLFRLYRFRNECSRVAGDCVYRTGYMPHTSRCQPSSVHFGHYLTEELLSVARWWKVHFYNRVATQPSPKMVADRSALQVAIASHRTASGCSLCFRPDQKMVGDNLCAVIEAKLSEVIEQVRLDRALSGTPKLMRIPGSSRCSNLVSYECPSLCTASMHSVQLKHIVRSGVKRTSLSDRWH